MAVRHVLTSMMVGCVALTLVAACSAPSPEPTSAPTSTGGLHPVGTPKVIASGLQAPWSILRLGSDSSGSDDSTLISERDSGNVIELTASGSVRTVGKVAGAVHTGEGGLLGIESLRDGNTRWLYAYETTATDNRIVRMPLLGSAGGYSLGDQQVILHGLAKAQNHDGGRIKFGPDGMLYATVGDAAITSRAQDSGSLNGKILRMTPTGDVPSNNPVDGSLVYSMGHRNPQGLAWDGDGQLWAAEFGQDTWDELNRIEPGANYGWPTVEGKARKTGFVDPDYQWSTSEASPSGVAWVDGTFFLAALRGERLWAVTTGAPFVAVPYFENDYGRIRDVVAGPEHTLWILTNNTDGRGSPKQGDDKLLQIELG